MRHMQTSSPVNSKQCTLWNKDPRSQSRQVPSVLELGEGPGE